MERVVDSKDTDDLDFGLEAPVDAVAVPVTRISPLPTKATPGHPFPSWKGWKPTGPLTLSLGEVFILCHPAGK